MPAEAIVVQPADSAASRSRADDAGGEHRNRGRESESRDERDRHDHHDDGAEARYEDLARASPWAVLIHTGWNVAFANPAAIKLIGAQSGEQVIGRPLCEILALQADHLEGQPSGARAAFKPTMLTRLDGSDVPVSAAAIACRYRGRAGAQIILRVEADAHHVDSREQFLRRRDLLTELSNRTDFRERLISATSRASRSGAIVGVMLLDLDRFALVNAEHGHATGDKLIRAVAARLLGTTRRGDTLARVGGDEFGVILDGIGDAALLAAIAARFSAEIREPFHAGAAIARITASIGVSQFPADGEDTDTLLTKAEVAMSAAKRSGRDGYRVFNRDLEGDARREQTRRAELTERFATLTVREKQVVDGLVAGRSNKAIARWLGCSPRTVEAHRARIMEKMRTESLPELVRVYLDVGTPR